MSNKNKQVILGVIGLGGRGRGLMKTLLEMEDVKITAICDLLEDRVQLGLQLFEELGLKKAEVYQDYKKLLRREDLDGVLIASSWTTHTEIAIAAMKAGKAAASEVGGASSVEECWDLVKTFEETGTNYMLLENCCYGRDEMAILNMIRNNIFGELIHCQCGYEHDIQEEIVMGKENQHYRIHNHLHRNGDLYPTHGLGPTSKYLNINRGNRLLTLSSMASKSRGLHRWAQNNLEQDHPLTKVEFTKGDIVTTMIKCAHGETILITHDTSLPRPYSRGGRVQGTNGIWMEDNDSIYLDDISPEHTWEPFADYREKYEHPLWKEFLNSGVKGGHGGMDFLVLRAFVDSIQKDIKPSIDVYDAATWMAITPLSEQSVNQGGHPVNIPDFTNGKWIRRKPAPVTKYSLDE